MRIPAREISRYRTQTCSGAGAARSSRPKVRHAFIRSGCWNTGRLKGYDCFRELLAIRQIQVPQESAGKFLTVNLPAQRHCERNGPLLELHGKIVAALVHVKSDADYSLVWRVLLGAHLYKHTGELAPVKLNVVGQLDHGFQAELGAHDVGDGLEHPNRQPPRIAEL